MWDGEIKKRRSRRGFKSQRGERGNGKDGKWIHVRGGGEV